MGRVLVAVGILSALFGLAAEALYAANAISSDTSADLGLVSWGPRRSQQSWALPCGDAFGSRAKGCSSVSRRWAGGSSFWSMR
jgi:hypothetical protein